MYQTAKRTQLYLPLSLYQAAKKEAQFRGISLANIVRMALMEFLGKAPKPKKVNWEKDPLNKAVGFFKGPKDFASKIDDVLYS